jgi:hypothetical protein
VNEAEVHVVVEKLIYATLLAPVVSIVGAVEITNELPPVVYPLPDAISPVVVYTVVFLVSAELLSYNANLNVSGVVLPTREGFDPFENKW